MKTTRKCNAQPQETASLLAATATQDVREKFAKLQKYTGPSQIGKGLCQGTALVMRRSTTTPAVWMAPPANREQAAVTYTNWFLSCDVYSAWGACRVSANTVCEAVPIAFVPICVGTCVEAGRWLYHLPSRNMSSVRESACRFGNEPWQWRNPTFRQTARLDAQRSRFDT